MSDDDLERTAAQDVLYGCAGPTYMLSGVGAVLCLICSGMLGLDYLSFAAMESGPAALSASMSLLGLVLFVAGFVLFAVVGLGAFIVHRRLRVY